MSGGPQRDQAYSNFRVSKNLAVGGRVTTNQAVIGNLQSNSASTNNLAVSGGNIGDILMNNGNGNAVWSGEMTFLSQAASDSGIDTYSQLQINKTANFNLNSIIQLVATGGSAPAFPTGRTITFQNQSTSALDLYLTVGYPSASGPTLLTTLTTSGGSATYVWNIPSIYGWSGNFSAYVSGISPFQGSTRVEFGLNQIWTGYSPVFRDTFDISCVSPGIGSQFPNGPRSACVALSQQNGFSVQQSYGYNVGVQIVPTNSGSLEFQTVTCTTSNGDSADSVGYPNDTAYPKQQTVQCLNNAAYAVNFLDPVFVD